MNGFDVAVLSLLGVFAVVGLFRGITRILVGLAAFVAAFFLAARFHEPVAALLGSSEASEGPRKLAAYALVFLGTMLAGGVLAWFLRKLLKVAMLGWADRLAGGALGLAAALLVAALGIAPIVAYSNAGRDLLARSLLAPYVSVVADLGVAWMPEGFATSYRRGVASLRERWGSLDGSVV